ncbi:MAG TPA: hypothetical protein VF466_02620 [Candidatus Saccharimonadales bacterium]
MQAQPEVMQYVQQPTVQELISDGYLQAQYGHSNNYRVDPWAPVYEPAQQMKPYMVRAENGQMRYETHQEKSVRVGTFLRMFPDADVLERHNFEASGQLPPRMQAGIDAARNRQAYDAVNPWNPNATNPYDLSAVAGRPQTPTAPEGLPAAPLGQEYGWVQPAVPQPGHPTVYPR